MIGYDDATVVQHPAGDMKTTVQPPDGLVEVTRIFRQGQNHSESARATRALIDYCRAQTDKRLPASKGVLQRDGVAAARPGRFLGANPRKDLRRTRRMIALDTNILVYAHRQDSPWHSVAFDRVTDLAEGRTPWMIPWPCVHGFLAVGQFDDIGYVKDDEKNTLDADAML